MNVVWTSLSPSGSLPTTKAFGLQMVCKCLLDTEAEVTRQSNPAKQSSKQNHRIVSSRSDHYLHRRIGAILDVTIRAGYSVVIRFPCIPKINELMGPCYENNSLEVELDEIFKARICDGTVTAGDVVI
ncbi:hypothetical protein Bpfe_001842 [Biomphalaria pfeifferi]|uniref:Uncharacterized protein n=1 Tax=Biomphalaria pfeifferi TaxID=112525 RepID=A0AAD8C9R6_BIOPF|nr:hypothetical protein Bpfe_001842 [Biomphalaria pfeifferi]